MTSRLERLRIGGWEIPERLLLIVRWLTAIAYLAAVVSYLLLQFGYLVGGRYVVAPLLIVLFGTLQLIAEASLRVRSVEEKVDKILVHEHATVRSLDSCSDELLADLRSVRGAERIDIVFLGLGFREGTSHVRALLQDTSLLCPLHLRILLLSTKGKGLGPARASLRKWWSQSAQSINEIETAVNWVAKNQPLLTRTVEIKQYREVPFFHGFAVTRPFVATYYSYCRWNVDDHYDWDRYYRTFRGDTPTEAGAADAAIFHSFLHHLWRVADDAKRITTVRSS